MDLSPTLKKWFERIVRGGNASQVLPNLRQPILAMEWDRAEIRIAVALQRKDQLQLLHAAHLARTGDNDPLTQVQSYLAENRVQVSQLALVLSRSDLELTTLSLPPVSESEIAVMVQAEVEQKLGDADHLPVADYVKPRISEGGPLEVLVFSLSEAHFASWQNRAKAVGLKLISLTSRHLAPIIVLQDQKALVRPRSVIVTAFAGEIELVVCYGSLPHFVRSLRVGSDDPDSMAEQVAMEIQRSLALEPQSDSLQPLDIFLFGSEESPPPLLEALRNRKVGEVHLIDAMRGWSDQRVDSTLGLAGDGAPLGALQGVFQRTHAIDLVAPKRPPQPASSLRRWGLIGGTAAASVALGGYFLWSDVDKLRLDVEELQTKSEKQTSLTKKSLEKADEVIAVENWLAGRIDWLEELRELSDRLPPSENATVRRLSASSNERGGEIDIALQVRQAEHIAVLEEQLRSARFDVTSKRVSEQTADDEFPWDLRYPHGIRAASLADPIPIGHPAFSGKADQRYSRQTNQRESRFAKIEVQKRTGCGSFE